MELVVGEQRRLDLGSAERPETTNSALARLPPTLGMSAISGVVGSSADPSTGVRHGQVPAYAGARIDAFAG